MRNWSKEEAIQKILPSAIGEPRRVTRDPSQITKSRMSMVTLSLTPTTQKLNILLIDVGRGGTRYQQHSKMAI